MLTNGIIFIIGIIAIPFIFVVIVTLIKSLDNRKKMRMKADLYLKALEKGVELPEDVLEMPKKKHVSLKTGILLTSAGLGIILFMFLVAPEGMEIKTAATGLVPLFLGLGFLVVYFVFKKQGIPDEED
ncbi:MAG: DUF6249 domain-containing protein [Tannerella sp.]|jgi:hypothetical protein|nr:DUF6249 domain-containing protein [Tannerella sp.]